MATKNGFTLIELVIVLIIIGISAWFLMPILRTSIEQTKAQTAKNNLLAIAGAQAKFYEDYSSYCSTNNISPCYCISTGTNPVTGNNNPECGDTLIHLNTYLQLSMSTQDTFQYSCTNGASPYQCTATDGTDTLTLSPNAQPPVICVSSPYNNLCPS